MARKSRFKERSFAGGSYDDIKVLYVGVYKQAKRVGVVSGKEYLFGKDTYNVPVAVKVQQEDVEALLAEKGKGCVSHAPERLFVTQAEWDEEINLAKKANK